jgi:hypothetical protein
MACICKCCVTRERKGLPPLPGLSVHPEMHLTAEDLAPPAPAPKPVVVNNHTPIIEKALDSLDAFARERELTAEEKSRSRELLRQLSREQFKQRLFVTPAAMELSLGKLVAKLITPLEKKLPSWKATWPTSSTSGYGLRARCRDFASAFGGIVLQNFFQDQHEQYCSASLAISGVRGQVPALG